MTFQLYLANRKNASNSTSKAKSLKWSEETNCMSCKLYSACKNKSKEYLFVCDKFDTLSMKKQFTSIEDYMGGAFSSDEELPKKINKSGDISDLVKIDKKLAKVADNDTGEFNTLLDRVVSEFSSGLPRDFKIDDRDLPLAKNFLDWSINPRFAGDDPILPFAKQIEIGINFYTEYCPRCSDWEYARDIPVDATMDQIQERITLLEYGVCPLCKHNRFDIWADKEFPMKRYQEIMGIGGQRGGKTAAVGRLNGYHSHRMFKLNRPHKVFGIEQNLMLESTFTATEYTKAKTNLFDPLSLTFRTNPWFVEYNKMLDGYGKQYGEELYRILGETIVYRHRNYLYYAHAPSPANMRGATRIIADIDEYDHLFAKVKDAKNLNPREVRNSLRNSLVTLRVAYVNVLKQGFFDVPGPVMKNITSPRSINGEAMRLVRESEHQNSRIYSFHYTIYEMNPNVSKDKETLAELEELEREDPEAFKRDFLAIPPNAANAFITSKVAVKSCILDKHVNAITMETEEIKGASKHVKMLSASYVTRQGKKIDFKTPKVMGLDAGLKDNAFAISIGHLHDIKYPNGDSKTVRRFDIVQEIVPKNGRELNFPDIYDQVIAPIIEEFNVVFVVADRWNSIHILQQIDRDFNIPWKQYTCKYKDFTNFKNGIYSGDIQMPMPEVKIDDAFSLSTNNYPLSLEGKPVAHALLQMLTVQDIMGKKVDKGDGYTDDIFRSLVVSNSMMMDEDVINELLTGRDMDLTNHAVGVVGGFSTGTTSLGGGSIGNSVGSGGASVGAIGSYSGWGVKF